MHSEAGVMTVHVPSPGQLRAARAALNWSLEEAADDKAIGVSRNAMSRYEQGAGRPTLDMLMTIKARYEAHGIVFLEQDGRHGILYPPAADEVKSPRVRKRASRAG